MSRDPGTSAPDPAVGRAVTPILLPRLAGLLLAVSVSLEIAVLADVLHLGLVAYNLQHLILMLLLIVMNLALYLRTRAENPRQARLAMWVAMGAASTTVGDWVNGSLSGVEPVSRKLTWALLFFGVGYSLYIAAMADAWRTTLATRRPRGSRARWYMALPIAAGNTLAWYQHVYPHVADYPVLCWGSLIFNATIYTLLPLYALWHALLARGHARSLIVLAGALWLPYSDLILFDTWLRGGDIATAPLQLLALNWILYFGGQALFAMFPAFVLAGDTGHNA